MNLEHILQTHGLGGGSSNDDHTNSPGSKKLIAGNISAGYFGVVHASELFTGTELAIECGITQGTAQFSDVGWLKFVIDGKIIFKSQKTYRRGVNWDHIDSKGCARGTKLVTKDGRTYSVRLMKGGNGLDYSTKASEWNRLMLPIHIEAKDQSWKNPARVHIPTPYWGIDFTDEDLQTGDVYGIGSNHLCYEAPDAIPSYRVFRGGRGGSGGISVWGQTPPNIPGEDQGWSPVLEVVE